MQNAELVLKVFLDEARIELKTKCKDWNGVEEGLLALEKRSEWDERA